jgi:alpha-glucosidase
MFTYVRPLVLSTTFALLAQVTASQGLNSCPGYKASNVVSTDSTLTADLTLNGPACNIYGTDLDDLKLVVEYQTGK